MSYHRTLTLTLIITVLLCVPLHTRALSQGPPTDVNDTLIIDGICSFPVLVELHGKAKTITPGQNRLILISPGVTASFTNLDNPAHHQTLGITGAFHLTIMENGDVGFVVTGRNLLVGVDANEGFLITIGRFGFVLDADGNVVQPLSGPGRVIDVCTLLE